MGKGERAIEAQHHLKKLPDLCGQMGKQLLVKEERDMKKRKVCLQWAWILLFGGLKKKKEEYGNASGRYQAERVMAKMGQTEGKDQGGKLEYLKKASLITLSQGVLTGKRGGEGKCAHFNGFGLRSSEGGEGVGRKGTYRRNACH